MRQISLWAKNHVLYARLIITLIKMILIVLAIYVGFALFENDIILPGTIIYAVFGIATLFAALYYPKTKKIRFGYIKQKACDCIISVSSFMIVMTMVNNGDVVATQHPVYGSEAIEHPSKAQEILASLKFRDASTLTHKEKRILRRELGRQLKTFLVAKAKGDKEKADNSWKIILAVIVALGLLALLIPLVCSLSCNGSDFLAILVAIAGVTAIVWLFIRVLHRIQRSG